MNDPINLIDPMGTDWRGTTASFSAGIGDVMLLGFGEELRIWTDETFGLNGNALVDQCSSAYSAGEWTGIAASTLIGGAAGWRAAGKTLLRRELSHAIPNRILSQAGSAIRNGVGRSRLNGNYASAVEHALNDPYRYNFMSAAWRSANQINPAWLRMINRMPKSWVGGGVGSAYGGAGAAGSGGGCGCP